MIDNIVILGVTKTTEVIFNEEFPHLTKINIEPYSIKYSSILPLWFKLLCDAPRIFLVIKKERMQLETIIRDHKINVVISDNRFGLYNKFVECIYITHQLSIQAGIASFLANKIHHYYIKKFNAVWVPDFEKKENSLAGNLSRSKIIKNIRYIGSLSRLLSVEKSKKHIDYLFLLSGPEPQRTLLEGLLIELSKTTTKKITLVRGSKDTLKYSTPKNLEIYSMADSSQLSYLISVSTTILCRSGYSTLMDLNTMRHKNIWLVPTPGQPEQLYLAGYWKEKFGAKVILQNKLSTLILG